MRKLYNPNYNQGINTHDIEVPYMKLMLTKLLSIILDHLLILQTNSYKHFLELAPCGYLLVVDFPSLFRVFNKFPIRSKIYN